MILNKIVFNMKMLYFINDIHAILIGFGLALSVLSIIIQLRGKL